MIIPEALTPVIELIEGNQDYPANNYHTFQTIKLFLELVF
jgi:hypothetical protein